MSLLKDHAIEAGPDDILVSRASIIHSISFEKINNKCLTNV